MPRGFLLHPGGMFDNSPTFQRWVAGHKKPSVPKGRLRLVARSAVPSGRTGRLPAYPNVETLGYYQASLRDEADPSGVARECPRCEMVLFGISDLGSHLRITIPSRSLP